MPSSCFRSMRCNSLLAPSFDEFWVRYGWKNMEPSSPYPLEDPWSIWSEARWQIHGENSSILYWIFYTWMLKETLRRSLSANSSGLFRTNIGSQQRWHRPPPTHGSASETPFAHLQVLEKRVPLLLASLLIGLWQKAVCLRLVRERFQQCNNGKQLKATVVNSISPSSESRTACWPFIEIHRFFKPECFMCLIWFFWAYFQFWVVNTKALQHFTIFILKQTQRTGAHRTHHPLRIRDRAPFAALACRFHCSRGRPHRYLQRLCGQIAAIFPCEHIVLLSSDLIDLLNFIDLIRLIPLSSRQVSWVVMHLL